MATTRPSAPREKIRLMISSRSRSPVFDPPIPLQQLRERLRAFIEGELTLGGEAIFEVWICEDDTGSGIDSWWEESKSQIRKADLVLILYTGEAGSKIRGRGIGICHAELFEAAKFSREKILPIVTLAPPPYSEATHDRAFQDYVEQLNPWPNAPADEAQLQEVCTAIIRKRVVDLTKRAVVRRRGASFDLGNALDWSKLDFRARKERIEDVLKRFLVTDMAGRPVRLPSRRESIIADLWNTPVCWHVHGIPAATSIAAAREMVGQPFLDDHLSAKVLKKNQATGPVHIVGCHKGITESQALRIRGVSDCTLVKTDFGIYLADDVLKVQVFFLANCRDVTATQSAVTEMFQWLDSAEESDDVAQRAAARTRILAAIAREIG